MADPLSVTASVIAVVTAGVAISKGLYQIAETMGSAGTDVRWYANDIRLLTTVLDGISDQLNKKPKQSWSKAERVIMGILDVCNGVLGPMNDIQKSLILLLVQFEHSNKKLRQVSARVWWFFKYKDKMVSFRQSLQNLNITLNTQLAAMKLNTAENVSINIKYVAIARLRYHADFTISFHQTSLQLCVAEAEGLLNDRTQLQLGLSDASPGRAIAGGANAVKHPSLPLVGNLREQVNSEPKPDPTEVDDEVIWRSQESTPNVTDMSQALILYPGQEEELDEDADGLDTEEIIEVERAILGTLDHTSDGSIQDIWEDLGSALRKVIRYAQEVNYAATQAPPQAVPDELATRVRSPPVHFGDVRVVPSHDAPFGAGVNSSLSSPQIPVNDQFVIIKHLDGKDYLFPFGAVRDWDVSMTISFSGKSHSHVIGCKGGMVVTKVSPTRDDFR
jgi:hypothetical protein